MPGRAHFYTRGKLGACARRVSTNAHLIISELPGGPQHELPAHHKDRETCATVLPIDIARLIARAVVFTILVPGTVTVWLPMEFYNPARAIPERIGWLRQLGWTPIAAGVAL